MLSGRLTFSDRGTGNLKAIDGDWCLYVAFPTHDDYIEVRHSSLRLPRITGYRAQRDKLFAVVIGLRP